MARTKQVGGFVLAGGTSSRMGRDKALVELNGIPLLVRTARLLETVVNPVRVIGPPERYATLGLDVVPDDSPGMGPLGGIATALRVATCPWNLVLACDLPHLTRAWLEQLVARALLTDADVLVPESSRGLEPLCAVYHNRCKPAIERALARGTRKVIEWLADPGVTVERITEAQWKTFDSGGWLFKNMNTQADYEEARARLEEKQTR